MTLSGAKISSQTIVAQATPPGKGGVGIVRVSGPLVQEVAKSVVGKLPQPRFATFLPFKDVAGKIIDQGIALYFPAPNSFTGEDVLELHAHGGPVVIDGLIHAILKLGVRLAQPGEFSQRAFLNNKIDLAQAEAIADLINASSEQAAQSALRALQGEFSQHINELVQALMNLRVYVEAALDFPDEEVDFLSDGKVLKKLQQLQEKLIQIKTSAQQGQLLQEGITVVIAGKPNVGKSSLLNRLSGQDSAIVTEIAGTTRDMVREHIQIDGLPVRLVDTAGLRDSPDCIEAEGIRRAKQEIEQADYILLVTDVHAKESDAELLTQTNPTKTTIVCNKIDLIEQKPKSINGQTKIFLSAKTGSGLEELKQHIKTKAGFTNYTEGNFIARRRHLDAIEIAVEYLQKGMQQLEAQSAGELLAEELKQAQLALAQITGEFTSDDLLGKIFSSFCIGK